MSDNLLRALLLHAQTTAPLEEILTLPPGAEKKRRILYAPMPKTGSGYGSRLLHRYLSLPILPFAYAGGRSVQLLYPPAVLARFDREAIAYIHSYATEDVCNLVEMFDYDVITQTRNIFDLVVSFRDHGLQSRRWPASEMWNIKSLNLDSFERWDAEAQLDAVIDLAAPALINFYASWYTFWQRTSRPPLWLNYEQMFADPHAVLKKVSAHLGQRYDDERARAIVDELERSAAGGEPVFHMNKGISGRGDTMLSDGQKDRIIKMLNYFDDVDFLKFGLR